MHKLEITLKQHTPLIHFQHDQNGATLRASEVKPKLDRFILTKLGDGNYEQGSKIAKDNGWLIGKGEHPALDYKMRIECEKPIKVALPLIEVKKKGVVQKDELGRILFTTQNYPDNMNSLIMSNMGGRIKENVFNFVLFNNIKIIIIYKNDLLIDNIKKLIFTFFIENGFGNRISKGFGSFTVNTINGEKCREKASAIGILSFSINAETSEIINLCKAYEDIFVVINKVWKGLKQYGNSSRDGLKSVFLRRPNQLTGREDRIPSPLIFKPIIKNKQCNNKWEVLILAQLNKNVICKAGANVKDFLKLINNAIKNANSKEEEEYKNNYVISNIKII